MPIKNIHQGTNQKQTIKPKLKLKHRAGQAKTSTNKKTALEKTETVSQLHSLGYATGDRIYVRLIAPKKLPIDVQLQMGIAWEPEPGKKVPIPVNGYLTLSESGASFTRLKKRREDGESVLDDNGKPIWDESKHYEDGLNQLSRWNSQGYGVYYVVNPGGIDDKDIGEARTLFYECDEVDKTEQRNRLQQLEFVLGRKATLVVETRNSLHNYFGLTEPENELSEWTQYQQRLIQGQDSDRSIWNPSRLMRLAGFDHKKWNEETQSIESVPVKIVQQYSSEFDLSDFDEFLPEWDKDLWSREETQKQNISLGEFSITNFAQYLEGYNPDGREGWITCQCPTHTKGGGNHSLDSLHINTSTGKFKCHSGCDPKQIYADAKEIAIAQGFKPKPKRRIETIKPKPHLKLKNRVSQASPAADKTAEPTVDEAGTRQDDREQEKQAQSKHNWASRSNYQEGKASASKPQQKPEQNLSQIYLDKKISGLGRQIVDELGEIQDETQTFQGRYKYKVSLNLNDNTLKIYSRDRGVDPILVDANGKIDHENSQVKPEDVKHFQAVVDQVNLYYAKSTNLEPEKETQLELDL